MATSVGLQGVPAGTSAVATHFLPCTKGLGFPAVVRLLGVRVGLPVQGTAPAGGDAARRRPVEAIEAAAPVVGRR